MAINPSSPKGGSRKQKALVAGVVIVAIVLAAVALGPLMGGSIWDAIVGIPSIFGAPDFASFGPGNPFENLPNQEEMFKLPENPFEYENPF
jgi:hypothetical protein